MKLLIIYATVYGQSERVARRIEDSVSELAVETIVRDVRDATTADLEACGAVVIVASVLYGHHSRAVRRFVKANRARLAAMRSAFVSVSGSAVDAETRPEAERYVRDFLRATGWTPTRYELVGGAVSFTRYNPLIRWVTKRAMAAKGKTLDTHRDYEFTDWDAVTRFARSFVATAAPDQGSALR